jgi:hypothetical protein
MVPGSVRQAITAEPGLSRYLGKSKIRFAFYTGLPDPHAMITRAVFPQASFRNWLSVLKASYVVFELPPFFENV